MSLETPRTFTQEQAQAMYLFIEKLAQVSLLANPMTGGVYPLGVEARELLQAIATPASENASADGARFVPMKVLTGQWRVWEYALGLHHEHSFTPEIYATEAEANAAAGRLNAGSQGMGE